METSSFDTSKFIQQMGKVGRKAQLEALEKLRTSQNLESGFTQSFDSSQPQRERVFRHPSSKQADPATPHNRYR